MAKQSRLSKFVASVGIELFPAPLNETVLGMRYRLSFSILERMERFDQAGLVTREKREQFDALFRDVIAREQRSRYAMQEERREQAFKGLR